MVAETAMETKTPAVIAGNFSLPLLHHDSQERIDEMNADLSLLLDQTVKFVVHPPDRSDKEAALRAYEAATDLKKKQNLLQIFKGLPVRAPVDFFCTLTIQGITRPLRLNPVHSKNVTVPAGFQHGPQVGYMPFPRPPPIKSTTEAPLTSSPTAKPAAGEEISSQSPETPDVLDIDQSTADEKASVGSESPPLLPTVRLSDMEDEEGEEGDSNSSSRSDSASTGPDDSDDDGSSSLPSTERNKPDSARSESSPEPTASHEPPENDKVPSSPQTRRAGVESRGVTDQPEPSPAKSYRSDPGWEATFPSDNLDTSEDSTTDESSSEDGEDQAPPPRAPAPALSPFGQALANLANNPTVPGEEPLPTSRGQPKGLLVELNSMASGGKAATVAPLAAAVDSLSLSTAGSSGIKDQVIDENNVILSTEALNKLHYVTLRKLVTAVPDFGDLDKYHRKEDIVRALHGQALPIAELIKLGIDLDSLMEQPDIPESPQEAEIYEGEPSTPTKPIPAVDETPSTKPREGISHTQILAIETQIARQASETLDKKEVVVPEQETILVSITPAVVPPVPEAAPKPEPDPKPIPAPEPVINTVVEPIPHPMVAPVEPEPAPVAIAAPVAPTPAPVAPTAASPSISNPPYSPPCAMPVSREDLAQLPMEMLRRIAATHLAPGAWKKYPRKADLVRALVIKGVTISALEPAAMVQQPRAILPSSRPAVPPLRMNKRSGTSVASNTSSPALSPRNELRPGTELLVYRVEWRRMFGLPVPIPVPRRVRRTPGNTPGTTPGTTPRSTPKTTPRG